VKPVMLAMQSFSRMLDQWKHAALPERLIDAVCILTEGQDQWGVATTSFTLAKQAGLDIRFCYESQDLPESAIYLMPSVSGLQSLSRRRILELLERVRAGAVLYISCDDALLNPFDQLTGLRVLSREQRTTPAIVNLDAIEKGLTLTIDRRVRLNLAAENATILGTESDGGIALSVANVGKGKVVFLSAPLEKSLMDTPGALVDGAAAYWKLYRYIASLTASKRIVSRSDTPHVAVTEHPIDAKRRLAILINYSPRPQTVTLSLTSPWTMVRTFPNSAAGGVISKSPATVEVTLAANRGLIVELLQ